MCQISRKRPVSLWFTAVEIYICSCEYNGLYINYILCLARQILFSLNDLLTVNKTRETTMMTTCNQAPQSSVDSVPYLWTPVFSWLSDHQAIGRTTLGCFLSFSCVAGVEGYYYYGKAHRLGFIWDCALIGCPLFVIGRSVSKGQCGSV